MKLSDLFIKEKINDHLASVVCNEFKLDPQSDVLKYGTINGHTFYEIGRFILTFDNFLDEAFKNETLEELLKQMNANVVTLVFAYRYNERNLCIYQSNKGV